MDASMCEIRLPSRLIIKGLISGEPTYNYEYYLVELLNSSIFFYKKTGGLEFVRPQKEDDGEPDCYAGTLSSNSYCLDFKLFAGNSLCHALACTSPQYYVKNGNTITTSPRVPESMTGSFIHKLFRNSNNDRFEYCGEKDGNEKMYQNDIDNIVEKVLTSKNLFILYPFTFSFKKEYNFNYAVSLIRQALKEDFLFLFQYREKKKSSFETYFSFIYCDFLVVLQYAKDDLRIVDYINTTKSKIYTTISDMGF